MAFLLKNTIQSGLKFGSSKQVCLDNFNLEFVKYLIQKFKIVA